MTITLLSRRIRPSLLLATAAALFVEVVARLTGGPSSSQALISHPFSAIAAASVYFRLVLRTEGATRRRILLAAPLSLLPSVLLRSLGAPPPIQSMAVFDGLGLVGVFGFALCLKGIAAADARRSWIDEFQDAVALPLAASTLAFGLWASYHANPVYDLRVYAFERTLGGPFVRFVVQATLSSLLLTRLANAAYSALPIGLALLAALQPDERRRGAVLAASIAAAAIGFLLYFVCPVVGTLITLGPPYPAVWPAPSAGTPLFVAPFGAPRNGMPSLHTAWALLIWFNAGALRPAFRRAFRFFALANIWAAMGPDGQHWFLDVVVGVPLAVAIQSAFIAARFEQAEHAPLHAWSSALIVFAWLTALKLGWPLAAFTFASGWIAVAVTVAWPLACRADGARRLQPSGRLQRSDRAAAGTRARLKPSRSVEFENASK